MNDSKYGRLYPERAVAPLRDLVEGLLMTIVGSQTAHMTQVELKDLRAALNAFTDNCFPPDEPLFLLRGQDRLASATVGFYFDLVHDEGLSAKGIAEVIQAMAQWQPRKMPD